MSMSGFVPAPLRGLPRRVLQRFGLRPTDAWLAFDPSDRAARACAAEQVFEIRQREHPVGTLERGRLLLRLIEGGLPTQLLADRYFENLDALLQGKPGRNVPGNVLLGVGSGRSGSTSLTALLRTIEGSCCTHENPPLIDWSPHPDQVAFHLRRMQLLADHFAVVADVAHWWLNVLDPFFEHFPDAKVVGLVRDAAACARSFMSIKGSGVRSFNHWAAAGTDIWRPHVWDHAYPSYAAPDYSQSEPDRAKYEMIFRYVRDYNAQLEACALRWPDRILLARTEQLGQPDIQQSILDVAGAPGRMLDRKFNVRTVAEGEVDELIY